MTTPSIRQQLRNFAHLWRQSCVFGAAPLAGIFVVAHRDFEPDPSESGNPGGHHETQASPLSNSYHLEEKQ